jgi:hypothetical protein
MNAFVELRVERIDVMRILSQEIMARPAFVRTTEKCSVNLIQAAVSKNASNSIFQI